MDNETLIQKTLTSSDYFSGGELNPEQQDRFVQFVKKFSVLLKMARVERMTRPKMEVDKMHVGEPITESADENVFSGYVQRPKFNQIELSAKKVRSAWNMTTESIQGNIEQDRIEDSLMEIMTQRITTDLEMLSISGDTSLTGTDPVERLLKRLDGWDIQTDSAHIVDASGLNISKEIFSEMKRRMPKQYKNDPELRFFVSDAIWNDWVQDIADRGTPIGDQALEGYVAKPFGVPLVNIPLIPDDKALAANEATHGRHKGTQYDPFEMKAGANKMQIKVDGGAAHVVTFPVGTYHAIQLANLINNTHADLAGVATDDSEGRLLLISPTTGAGSSIAVEAVADDCYAELGMTVGVYSGAAADPSNLVYEGSFILLCNPKNLVWGILDGTRIYSEFNKDYDRVETVVYNQVDAKIENLDAIVKCINVRRKSLM